MCLQKVIRAIPRIPDRPTTKCRVYEPRCVHDLATRPTLRGIEGGARGPDQDYHFTKCQCCNNKRRQTRKANLIIVNSFR